MLYEAGTYLGALQDRERARLTPNLNAALDEGRKIARADYDAALERRATAIAFFQEWLAGYDAIIAPPRPGRRPKVWVRPAIRRAARCGRSRDSRR